MSSDGIRHEGEMASPDRDSVYAALRRQGIRAIKVTERIQPVARRGLRSLRKRDWTMVALIALMFALVIVAVALLASRNESQQSPETSQAIPKATPASGVSSQVVQIAQPRPRHFLTLPDDVDLSAVFTHPHEVYLAHFAMPGIGTDGMTSMTDAIVRDFYDNLGAAIVIRDGEPASVAELKRMVAGMKDDVRKYLSVPDGLTKMGAWLEERQAMERDYRQQFISRVKSGNMTKEDANEMFRAMGLQEID